MSRQNIRAILGAITDQKLDPTKNYVAGKHGLQLKSRDIKKELNAISLKVEEDVIVQSSLIDTTTIIDIDTDTDTDTDTDIATATIEDTSIAKDSFIEKKQSKFKKKTKSFNLELVI